MSQKPRSKRPSVQRTSSTLKSTSQTPYSQKSNAILTGLYFSICLTVENVRARKALNSRNILPSSQVNDKQLMEMCDGMNKEDDFIDSLLALTPTPLFKGRTLPWNDPNVLPSMQSVAHIHRMYSNENNLILTYHLCFYSLLIIGYSCLVRLVSCGVGYIGEVFTSFTRLP
jgi:hypothetical protein